MDIYLHYFAFCNISTSSVARGVELFKEGNHVGAMQHLNKALQIDSSNVDAFVARGAL